MSDNLQLAVNAALKANASINDARMARVREGLLGHGLDDKRKCSAWAEYGFPQTVTYEMLVGLYRRGGLAHGAVNKIVGACWSTNPWIIEGDKQDDSKKENTREKKFTQVLTARIWRSFAEADKRRLVGRYSGLLLHINDNKAWNQPATKGKSLVKATPAWAGALKPTRFDTDEKSQTYGQPTEWQYSEVAAGSGVAGRRVKIHPDRVFILGDYAPDTIGFLEPAYNAFVSLEKVEGGSGESFLKNAARQVSVNFDKEIDFASLAALYNVRIDELQEKFNEAALEMNRGNDQMLITQGATVAPLVSAVSDPGPTYNVNLQTAVAALDMPSRILVGNQSGERSSTEDNRYFNGRCQSRRNGDLSFDAEDLVDHLIRIGVVDPAGEKTVMWDDLNEQTSTERLDSAKKMSEVNQVAIATGELVFDRDEIRTAAGFDPIDGEPSGEDDEDEDGEET
ncbi:anti-CBASS protein Acb1 family protein [Pusillimonas sp. ANT_WB101]|uniref:anti-CBASS protein Acb1 family protein n=1 Tax=Pusillimonas sp. ANT_WB101 TaxID=2597356 RepID=UPI0011ED8820|nr:anti-CBASS Acb1 family protein [Pusillimonas sp. ANT_WB101]KAA0910675.1 DUF1073 domain-containing protein [Pusillimonas sp. ANT_WB101]